MMSEHNVAGPALAGMRVIECATRVAASFCARVLADFGAEVVKLEPPGGDVLRQYGPFPGDQPHPERSGLFAYLNAGKCSVALGAEAAANQRRIAAFASTADVLVTDLNAAGDADWRLDLDALRAANPALVTASVTPMGDYGPISHHRAHEINVSALAGVNVILGEPNREPLHFPYHLPALQAGFHGAAAVLTALLARRRCGVGQHIDISAVDVLAFYTGGMSVFILDSGGEWRRRGFERHGPIYPSGFYPCKDGFVFLATQTRDIWRGFLRLMGNPEWAQSDPALQDGVAIGWRRADEVDLHFIPWLTQYTRRQLVQMARDANLILGPINTMDDLLTEEHLEARNFWRDLAVDGTPLRVPGMGYTMSATPWEIGTPPKFGEHTPTVTPRPVPVPSVARPPRPLRRPLEGYRAIEFGWNWAGPMVGQILADLGMEVIKIETQARLDFMRHWQHTRKFFHNANRGKLSVSVNIKKPGGIELVHRLARHADLLFDNFAAGVMARSRLDYAHLRQVKPDIIVLSMAMAGQSGPLHHLRGFAPIATGFAGLENLIGYPDIGPTGLPVIGMGDLNAAIQSVVACLTALWHREQTGQGQFIDLSQIEAAATLVAEPLADYQFNGRSAGPRGNEHPWMAPHGAYPAAGDDRWATLAVGSNAEWAGLVDVMGRPAWACDEWLADRAGRYERRAELDRRLAEWTVGFDRDDLVARLQAAGVPAEPVLGIEELATHPHFRARELSQLVQSFEGSPERVYNTPWHLSLTPRGVDRPSPRVGEHNDYAFRQLLQMSDAEIAALAEQQVTW